MLYFIDMRILIIYFYLNLILLQKLYYKKIPST